MADMGRRQPAIDEPLHSFPLDATMLASSAQGMMPEVAHGETKVSEGVPITRDAEVANMPAHHGLQPRADHRNGVMHASLQVGFHGLQLRLHARAVISTLPRSLFSSVS